MRPAPVPAAPATTTALTPARVPDPDPLLPVTITVNGVEVSDGEITAAITAAIAGAGDANDGSAPGKPFTLEIAGLDVQNIPLMTQIYRGIEGAWVNLDLSGATCTSFNPGAVSSDKTKILSLTFSSTVTGFNGTFSSLSGLQSVTAPEVSALGERAFENCGLLKNVDMPEATSIGRGAFFGCTLLESVTLTKVTAIGLYAFRDSGLTSISLPEITTIGDSAFTSSALTSVDLPEATSIGNNAFGPSALESVTLPEATSIGYNAFYGCGNLTSVTLPKARSIDTSAFQGCAVLETVTLPEAATIGAEAFRGCTRLESVTMPKASAIGEWIFYGTGSQALTVTLGATPPTLGDHLFNNVTENKTVTVRRPSSAAAAYGAGVSGSDTREIWGNGFRGKGWPFSVDGEINTKIAVQFENSGS